MNATFQRGVVLILITSVSLWRQSKAIEDDVPVRRQLRHRLDTEGSHEEVQILSSVSARWGNQVVYGVATNSLEKYHDSLVAQLETWGEKPHSEGRFVVVAGRGYPKAWQERGTVLTTNCGDAPSQVTCKEARLIAEAAGRNVSWLFIVTEDNYVKPTEVESILQTVDADKVPTAMAVSGCGKGIDFCPQVKEQGGICGSGGYALNRAALHSLLGVGLPSFLQEYSSGGPGDMLTSCALLRRGVTMRTMFGLFGAPVFKKREYEAIAADKSMLTLHYVMPQTMRWLRAFQQHAAGQRNSDGELERLAAAAFEAPGCEIGKNHALWALQEYKECLADPKAGR